MKTDLLKFVRSGKNTQRLKFNKQLSVFLICFLIAMVFWFLISLTKNYSSVVSFPIIYTDLPKDKVITDKLPTRLKLELNARGFDLLGYHLKIMSFPIFVRVQPNSAQLQNRETAYLLTRQLVNSINKQLNSDARVIAIEPDTIYFNYQKRSTKKLPVNLQGIISYEKQYGPSGQIKVIPDSLWITGPESGIVGLKEILTKKVKLLKLNKTTEKELEISTKDLPAQVYVFQPKVKVTIPIEKYTEGTIEVPVNIKEGEMNFKLVQEKVKIVYQVPLSKYSLVNETSFQLEVAPENKEDIRDSKIKVKLLRKPPFVKIVRLTPSKVEIILKK